MTAQKLSSWVMLFLFSIVLSACGGGGSGGIVDDDDITVVSGVAQKGSFVSGSSVSIYSLNSTNGSRMANIATTTTTDDQGSYTVSLPDTLDVWVEVEITGKYFNEVTGTTSTSDRTLSAIGLKPLFGDLKLNVNAFTDIATDRIRKKVASGTDFAAADFNTRDEIKAQFDLENNLLGSLDIRDGLGAYKNDNATLLLFSGAVLSSGITDAEWNKFTTDNDAGIFDKIGSAVQKDPSLLTTLVTNVNNFITESGAGANFQAPVLSNNLLEQKWVNKLPTFTLGSDQVVNEQVTVSLTENQTAADSDGTVTSYFWAQSSGDVSVSLTSTDSNETSFVAPVRLLPDGPLELAFTLTVTDNRGGVVTDTVNVTVNPVNAPPVAKAGEDQTIKEKTSVTLSDATSSDADGNIVSYLWTQVGDLSKPVSLTGANSKTASFDSPRQLLPDGNHTLTFDLTVTDDEGVSNTDTIIVTVEPVNAAPVAEAGNNQIIKEQTSVTLSAAASSDSDDGSIISYAWAQTGDDTKIVTLTGASSATASFNSPIQLLPDGNHTLTFTLTVTDNEGVSHTDDVIVTVEPVNLSPIASAGIDQVIKEKLKVTLDASGSLDNDPPNGTNSVAGIKTYLWEQVNAGEGSTPMLQNADAAVATFTAPIRLLAEGEETLTFRVTVTDHENVSTSDIVTITVSPENIHPDAEAGLSQDVRENTEVTLNAVASTDSDGEIVTYKWEQTFTNVAGVSVVLNDASSIAPVFTTPLRLETEDLVVLTFRVTVTDNEGYTDEDTTTVTINPVNAIPVANAGVDREANEQTIVNLNGSASDDLDGEIVSYMWRQTGGETVVLTDADKAEATFTSPTRLAPDGTETLSFELKVTDNEEAVHTDTIDIIIQPVNILPIPEVGPDQTVDEKTTVNLTSSASSDEDSTVALKHVWEQVSGTPVALTGEETSTPSFTAPIVIAKDGETVAETLLFEVTVTDNEDGSNAIVEASSNHRVAITVKSVNALPVANAGADVSVDSESFVTLDGSSSDDEDGSIVSYLWEQKTGSAIDLSATDKATVTFTLPKIIGDSVPFSFDLTVIDNEGYSHTDSVVITADPASVGHAYLKGQLIDGSTTFTPYSPESGMGSVAYTTISKDHPESLSSAGLITVTEGAGGLEDDQLYVIKVDLGNDIDHDQDSERDESPTLIAGMMHSIMTGADLKRDNWTITPLTEIAYQQASSLLIAGASIETVQEQLDNSAKQLLADDLTADAIVNRDDLYAYVPTQDQGSLKLSSSILTEVISNLVAGEATLTASLTASRQVITTKSLLGGSAESVAIKGDYAYVAAGGFGLRVVDISNANDLRVVGIFDTEGFARDIEIISNYAYIADNTGLIVVNISNPEQPVSQKTIALSGDVQGLSLNDGYAYVATGNSGLKTFDITDPANPSYLGEFATVGPANDVVVVVAAPAVPAVVNEVRKATAYIAAGTGGLKVVNVTSRTNMSLLHEFDTAGTASDLVVDGNYVYVADGEKGLQIINISGVPLTLEGSLDVPGNTTGIKKVGNYLYLASENEGIHLVDVSDAMGASILNTVTTSSANDVTLLNDIAYVSDGSAGLTLVDVSTLSSQPHILFTAPKVASNHVGSVATVSDLAVIGISSGNTGIESFNTTTKGTPMSSGEFLISKPVLDTDTDGTYAYAAVGEDGVKIVNLSNSTTTNFDTTGVASAVKVSGGYLYVADGSAGLKIVDLSNTTQAGSSDTSGEAVDVAISSDNNYAYVADRLGGIQIIAINDKANPTVAATVNVDSGLANGVYLNDGTLYVATSRQSGNGTQGVRIYDASTPGTLSLLSTFDTPNLAYSTVVSGSYAYISNESDGIQVIDITDKTSPIWVANIDTSGLAHDLAVTDDDSYIYIADQHGGLSVIKAFSSSP